MNSANEEIIQAELNNQNNDVDGTDDHIESADVVVN
jgi:hypothetical protein